MRGSYYAAHLIQAGILALVGIVSTQALSQAQSRSLECGSFYRVQSGDTLRAITVRTYPHDRYQVVFSANRDILASPARIERGQLLFLPCAGTGPQTRVAALSQANITPTDRDQFGSRVAGNGAAQQSESVAQAEALAQDKTLPKRVSRGRKPLDPVTPSVNADPAVDPVALRSETVPVASEGSQETMLLLSASGLEPMAGSELPSGGLVSALIEQAFRSVAPKAKVQPVFVNDRKAHLDVLLPLDAFTLSYPWPAPDCSGQVGFHSKTFCSAFLASIPIFQIEMRIITQKDNPIASVTDVAALQSKAVCRPQDFPPYDLENQGMRRVIVAADLNACLKSLAEGKAEAVSVPAPMLKSVNLNTDLVDVDALRGQVPVHAIFHRTSPRAEELRSQLNEGLRRLQASGAWFSTVAAYLSDYNSDRLAAKD